MNFVTYVDANGLIYAISQGISGRSGEWFTCRRKPGKRSESRVSTPKLPQREKAEDAQNDLDEYAILRGWKPVVYYEDAAGSIYAVQPRDGKWIVQKTTRDFARDLAEFPPELLQPNAWHRLNRYSQEMGFKAVPK